MPRPVIVVLHHGLFGHGNRTFGPLKITYFRGIDRAITAAGHPLIITNVHPSSTVEYRATQLKEQLVQHARMMGGDKVILMAHSMGGLDARYAVSRLGMDRYVSAIVTIATPHRGSPFADWVIEHLGRRLRGMQLVNFLGLDLRAVLDLTTYRCAEFNHIVPNVPGVRYFSVSACRPWTKIPPFALHSYHVIKAAEGDNDGLVSVKSSTYGQHFGTWKADHWHTINRRWVPELKDPTGDIAPLWVSLLSNVMQAMEEKNEPCGSD